MRPQTQYVKSGDAYIAYQVVGDGPIDLVFAINWFGHLDLRWEDPHQARFLERLASFSRLILFDKRGTGLSDPVPLTSLPTLEEWMDDMRAVLDAVGSERAAQLGYLRGGMMSMLFAATYPERTSHLILLNSHARVSNAPGYLLGNTDDDQDARNADLLHTLLTGQVVGIRRGSQMDDPVYREWYVRYLRSAASPGTWEAFIDALGQFDVRPVLPSIHVPTLVLCRPTPALRTEASRYVADRISGARYVELPPADTPAFAIGDTEGMLGEIEEFLTGVRSSGYVDRVLATVLFTDIVESTQRVSEIGDSRWRTLIAQHDQRVRSEIARFNGREIHTAGDGFLATFDGPARAIRCARAITEGVNHLGLDVRAGLHTGEIELAGDDIRGIAVHIAARVSAMAGAREVLVSSTVKDLVAGSGIRFVDRGTHELKGVPDEWRIYSVDSIPA